jgi:hypothetical protein
MVCSNVNSEILDEPAKDVQNKLPPEKNVVFFSIENTNRVPLSIHTV